ncbi:MAG: DUF1273 family protein [Clostridia bacterium]|nr:DUF1273 family protein [Clostridia bacterium]
MEREKTACLTGHRPKYLPWGYNEDFDSCLKFKKDVREIFCDVMARGINCFLTGMAEGFDMIGAEVLIDLRKKNKWIKIIAVVPCKGQELKWTNEQQKRYCKILKKCDEVIVLSQGYTPTCMHERNKYMVEHSRVVIACYNGRPSGTGKTIKFASRAGCDIRVINPEDYI